MEAKLDRLVKSLIDYAYNAGSLMSEEKLHLLRLIEVDGLTAAFWSLAETIKLAIAETWMNPCAVTYSG